ncbi:hypothetical protein, partial [Planotetraspora sp. GP83]|uniref:hypothetical protein n=1 Tax=Planotetraspora sp. GP83 TaxID=3156264 RepID=UPI0035169638
YGTHRPNRPRPHNTRPHKPSPCGVRLHHPEFRDRHLHRISQPRLHDCQLCGCRLCGSRPRKLRSSRLHCGPAEALEGRGRVA